MGDIKMANYNNYNNYNNNRRNYNGNKKYSKYNPHRKVNYSRRTGIVLEDGVDFNNYDGVKTIRMGNGEMIDGFRIKQNHVAMFDDKGLLIKVATSIVTKPDGQFIIVFVRGKYEWLKNSYTIEDFSNDFGNEYIELLDGAKDIYAESGEAKEIYSDLMTQADYVSSHLFEVYSGRTEELVYLLDLVNKYNEEVCRRINISADILAWDNVKEFDLENDTITGGLPLYEDVKIEVDYIKSLGVENYLSFRDKIDNLAHDKFIQTIVPFLAYIKTGKWK